MTTSCGQLRTPALLIAASLVTIVGYPSAGSAQADRRVPAPLELIAPGLVSTDGGEAFPALSPDGTILYYATHEQGWRGFHLVASHLADGQWTAPSRVQFDTMHNDRAPFVSPDGTTLFFSSDRPLPEARPAQGSDFNLWFVERTTQGGWSDPRPVPGVNSRADDFHAAVSASGTLYFSSNRPGGRGQYDLYRAERSDDGFATPLNLGSAINTPGEETDVYVSPDESFLIVVATERVGGVGGDDLWLSARRGDTWSTLTNLGEPVNSSAYEYGPFVSPDGAFLYFTTHRRGLGDLVRVAVGDVPALTNLVGGR